MEIVDMDGAGAKVEWRKSAIDLDIHVIDVLDLERNGNDREKVIHTMWKK